MKETLRPQILAFVLRAVREMRGIPMPHATLIASITMGFPTVTTSEAEEVVSGLEADGYLSSFVDDITGRQWSLTTKGNARAIQL